MKYVIDIDGTITHTVDSDYENAIPRLDRIDAINKLYDEGHTIMYFSARGMTNPSNIKLHKLTQLTYTQLEQWGCKYHKLQLEKPSGDVYIDDKGINADEFFA